MLVTGVVGVVDRTLDTVGLGGIRRGIVRSLVLDKAMDKLGVNKVLGSMGLDGIFGGPHPPSSSARAPKEESTGTAKTKEGQSEGKSGGLPLVGSLGLGGSDSQQDTPAEATTTRKRDRKQGGDPPEDSAQGGFSSSVSQVPVVGSVVGGVGSLLGGGRGS